MPVVERVGHRKEIQFMEILLRLCAIKAIWATTSSKHKKRTARQLGPLRAPRTRTHISQELTLTVFPSEIDRLLELIITTSKIHNFKKCRNQISKIKIKTQTRIRKMALVKIHSNKCNSNQLSKEERTFSKERDF